LAVIVTVPADTPVTGTFTLADPGLPVTVDGTVATVGSLEVRFMTIALAGAEERNSIRFCGVPVLIVNPPTGTK
jgi:hypothetical protein